jgi:DMSO/TMAO reductase YedYZ molybdopterin-dependent catalytic subunit
VGALVVHIGAKSAIVAAAVRRSPYEAPAQEAARSALTRGGFLTVIGAAAGILTVTTIGQTVRPPLKALGLLAPRKPDVGRQGAPVNKTAASAGVEVTARDPSWRLSIEGRVRKPLTLSLEDLRRLPQKEVSLPIACVEGWRRWPVDRRAGEGASRHGRHRQGGRGGRGIDAAGRAIQPLDPQHPAFCRPRHPSGHEAQW